METEGKWIETAESVAAVSGAVIAMCGLVASLWRHGLRGFVRYAVSLGRMPLSVAHTEREVSDLKQQVYDGQQLTDGKFRILFADIQKPVWKSDGQGNCVYANPCMQTTLGRSMDDIRDQRWRSIIADEDREKVLNEWDKCILESRTFEMSYRWKHADGHLIPIMATGSVIRSNDGKRILGIVGIVTVLPTDKH